MKIKSQKIGFGGGCHWCTEAVFQSLKGVLSVEQGYLAGANEFSSFSEGVIVTFNSDIINLDVLVNIHLWTHKSTKNHSMRAKYRSAIYVFSDEQKEVIPLILDELNVQHNNNLVTLVIGFNEFKASRDDITNYYYTNPQRPFCETFINPKLKLILANFSNHVNHEKLNHLKKETTPQ